MNIDQIHEALSALCDEIMQTAEEVPAAKAGLDYRCGTIYIGEGFIATTNSRMLDYYGGFEYVDKELVQSLGPLKVYSAEDSRVQRHIEIYQNIEESDDE